MVWKSKWKSKWDEKQNLLKEETKLANFPFEEIIYRL